jgi:DNA-binding LacI/PurR family transcriptional regulator
VSKTTVTFVLAGRDDIAIPETTRNRVREAARELGYQPSAIAQALVTGKTNAITVAFPNLFVPHYARVLRAFEEHTNANGFHLIASTLGHIQPRNIVPDFYTVVNSPSDAVILVDMPDACKPYIAEMAPFSKPVVVICTEDVPGVDCVEIDKQTGADAAMAHLLESAPRRVAFFGFGSEDEMVRVMRRAAVGECDPRAIAYHRAMTETGRAIELIYGSHAGRRARIGLLREYVDRNGCPDAIYCYDDESAISAHHCLRRMGYRMPDDVLLTGYDGNEECEYLEPPLTTVIQPVEEMCSAAWEFIARRLNEDVEQRQHIKLDVQLAVRESSVRSVVEDAPRSLHSVK